jgi:hypothetical protein
MAAAVLEPTRVLLVDIPRVLEEIIRAAFAGDRAFLFVSQESSQPVDVVAAIDREGAGFVILWGRKPEPPEVFRRMLEQRPLTKMLALAGDGRENFLYVPLGELSPQALADAVRATAARGRSLV